MIRVRQHAQCRKAAQSFDQTPYQRQVGQRIACALEKQHRNPDLRQMAGALIGRSIGCMQWKAQEYQATNSGQCRLRLCLRGHATAERFASCNQRELWRKLARCQHGRSNRRVA